MCCSFLEELLILFNTLSVSEKIIKFCSESILSMSSSVLPIASAYAVNVEAILDILNFMLRPSFKSIDGNPTNGLAVHGETFAGSHSFLENCFNSSL
jgi:hypothetical protein